MVSHNIANSANPNVNAYVFLCSENDQGGTIGIAWVATTCDRTQNYRSSVTEYLNNDVVTASVSIFSNSVEKENSVKRIHHRVVTTF